MVEERRGRRRIGRRRKRRRKVKKKRKRPRVSLSGKMQGYPSKRR